MKRAIVIQGAPGVGKSTLATRLGEDLNIRVVMKDAFKEALYDTTGIPNDLEESKLYGRVAIRSMFAALDEFVKGGSLVIVEAPLNPLYAQEDLSHCLPLTDILQLHVFCDPLVQERRFRQRIDSEARHNGHVDEMIVGIEAQARYQPIAGIDTLSIDTTDFTNEQYVRLLANVRIKLEGSNDETTD